MKQFFSLSLLFLLLALAVPAYRRHCSAKPASLRRSIKNCFAHQSDGRSRSTKLMKHACRSRKAVCKNCVRRSETRLQTDRCRKASQATQRAR